MRRVVEHTAAAIALAALISLLIPVSVAPSNDHAMASAITSIPGVAAKPADACSGPSGVTTAGTSGYAACCVARGVSEAVPRTQPGRGLN